MNALTFSESLTLLALLGASEIGFTVAKLREAQRPALANQTADFSAALASLVARGAAEKLTRAPRQRTDRWRLTAAGREALAASLGALPAAGRGALVKAAHALAAAQVLGLAPGAAAAMAASEAALPAYFLAQKLGREFIPGMTGETLARDAAAMALGASNAQPATLRAALLARALHASPPLPFAAVFGGPAPARESFSAQTLRAARTAPADAWFGPRKLFIHRAWERWRLLASDTATDLPTFKTRLLAALRAGELGLTRADFTATLAPADLAAAEVRDGGELFHFLTAERDLLP